MNLGRRLERPVFSNRSKMPIKSIGYAVTIRNNFVVKYKPINCRLLFFLFGSRKCRVD